MGLTLNALTRSNLVFPLGWENLGVDAGDLNSSKQAGTVMSLDNITAIYFASTDTTVVWALRTGETTLGPSVRVTKLIEESILLLKTEPRLLALVGLHEFSALVTVVELVGGTVRVPALSQDEDVVTTTERVREHGDRAEIDIGVFTWGLSGGRSVKVPFGKILNGGGLFLESLSWWMWSVLRARCFW